MVHMPLTHHLMEHKSVKICILLAIQVFKLMSSLPNDKNIYPGSLIKSPQHKVLQETISEHLHVVLTSHYFIQQPQSKWGCRMNDTCFLMAISPEKNLIYISSKISVCSFS